MFYKVHVSPGRCRLFVLNLCRWPERSSSLTPDFPPSQRQVRSLQHTHTHIMSRSTATHTLNKYRAIYTLVDRHSLRLSNKPWSPPGCFCRGLGRLVTQVWGHMRTLHGCSPPSRYSCLISDRWMPPSGVLGSVLAGTRARQNTPTPWILSMAWAGRERTVRGQWDYPLIMSYLFEWGGLWSRGVRLFVWMIQTEQQWYIRLQSAGV